MVFCAPSWAPLLSSESIPDSIPICDFLFSEEHGRAPLVDSKSPFVWGSSGHGYSALEVRDRVDFLARALAQELGWHPNQGTEWEKMVGVFSVNAIDYLPLGWAVHRLSGIATLANAAYSVDELTHQLRASKASALFTCASLLETALKAAENCGIPRSRIYILDTLGDATNGPNRPESFTSVSELIERGSRMDPLEALSWEKGQGAKQCAYLCFSSGTSGLPSSIGGGDGSWRLINVQKKGVMISHTNMISQILLYSAYESPTRTENQRDIALGLLPYSHIFGLAVFTTAVYRGETVVAMSKFDLESLFQAIQRCKINVLYLVPPVMIALVKNEALMKKYDLSSVRRIITGAAPLGLETAEGLFKIQPEWSILQAYGLTETTAVATHTSPQDIYFGSSGCLLPLVEARLLSPDGSELTSYDTPGELLLRGPTIVLGYLNNDAANKETFHNAWLRTGDEAVVRKSPKGEDHIFIVDRIKELIKVKGFQVAPAELEAHLLTHPAVADTAVIAVEDDDAGEVPKAFIVKSQGASASDQEIIRGIREHVEKDKAHYKWLRGGIEFISEIPKSASGKILRRHLRDRERVKRKRSSKL
ncbi:hypothetical protein FQN57_000702 [Myotisia sp. PD_48]|nr:hypothetical protein FQN57_000702 [Myotisia sp. PD_48]